MGQVFGIEMVGQSTVAIMQTCGKFDRVLDPGCHFVPCCIGSLVAGRLSLRVQQLDVRCETKTKASQALLARPLRHCPQYMAELDCGAFRLGYVCCF